MHMLKTAARRVAAPPTAGRGSRPNQGGPTLGLIAALLDALHHKGAPYCYWRSGARLRAVLAGEADLDLIAERTSKHLVLGVLAESGFKLFPSVASRGHPAVMSFLGHDASAGCIVHVHLHLAVVTGERLLRNYVLPWAPAFIARAVPVPAMHEVRVLDSADEAVVLAVRSCVELRVSDPIALRGWRKANDRFMRDQQALSAAVDQVRFHGHAVELVGKDAADLLAADVYAPQWRGLGGHTRRRVRQSLKEYRTYNGPEARVRAAWRGLTWLAGGLNKRHLHWPRPWSRLAPGSGLVVALMGVDGSGKSTVVAALRAWLGAEVDVMPIYFGTGDGRPSLLLLPLKAMVPLFTRVLRRKPRGSSHGTVSDRPPGLLFSVLLAGWATVLAVEKRSKLRAAHRGARRGLVVIADRYPQDEIVAYNDGPLLPRLARVPAWLRQFEARSYALAQRLPPDLVIKLEAPPETLAMREPSMDRGVIQERVDALQRLRFPGVQVVRVDAAQPLDNVLRAVKAAVWSLL